jgi:hypothetical protein
LVKLRRAVAWTGLGLLLAGALGVAPVAAP